MPVGIEFEPQRGTPNHREAGCGEKFPLPSGGVVLVTSQGDIELDGKPFREKEISWQEGPVTIKIAKY